MTAKCALCGDPIILIVDKHFEISLNKYACGKCVDLAKETELRFLLAKLLETKQAGKDAAAAAKRLGEGIKAYGVTAGGINAKD